MMDENRLLEMLSQMSYDPYQTQYGDPMGLQRSMQAELDAQEMERFLLEQQIRSRRGSSGQSPGFGNISSIMDMFGGGDAAAAEAGTEAAGIGEAAGGEGAGAAGGMGAGMAGLIAAIIAGQHYLSSGTNRVTEGVKTDDAFSGNFMTEPWAAYAMEKLGVDEPLAGEYFDAAMENKDYGLAAKRLPAALHYWSNPFGSLIGHVAKDKLGGVAGAIADPFGWILGKLGK